MMFDLVYCSTFFGAGIISGGIIGAVGYKLKADKRANRLLKMYSDERERADKNLNSWLTEIDNPKIKKNTETSNVTVTESGWYAVSTGTADDTLSLPKTEPVEERFSGSGGSFDGGGSSSDSYSSSDSGSSYSSGSDY